MKLEIVAKIVCRIVIHTFIFAFIGAFFFGIPWGILFSSLFWDYLTKEGIFGLLGLSAGAIQFGIIGLLTWRRRDSFYTLQTAIGGGLGGGIVGLILGKGATFVLSLSTNLKSFDVIYSLSFMFCALVGTSYFTFHPKYAPREEPVIIFSDDYLKDKIEWE